MTVSHQTPISQLVTEQPGRARVFMKYGIDFCCGGGESLSAACSRRGLAADDLVAELLAADATAPAPLPAWESLAGLTEHLVETHHRYLKEVMPVIAQLVGKVAKVHGEGHPELVELERVYARFYQDMSAHLSKEEMVLFPMVRELENEGSEGVRSFIPRPVSAMELEHEEAGTDLKRMRELTNGFAPPPEACNSYRAMLRSLSELEEDTLMHIHKENHQLFPRIRAQAS